MAEMKNIFISLVIIGLVVAAFSFFLSDTASNYQININENDSTKLAQLNATLDEGYEFSRQMQVAGEDITRGDIISGILHYSAAAFEIIKMPITTISTVSNITTDVGKTFGIPEFAYTAIYAIVVIIIIFLVVNAIIRWRT